MKHRYSEDTLRSAVSESLSLASVLRKLGITPAGGNYQVVKHRIKASGIDTSHFTGSVWSKGRTFVPKRPVNDYLTSSVSIGTHKLKKRLISEGIKEAVCDLCRVVPGLASPFH